MPIPQLGTLERVDLRTAWLHEAGDFTPWLARPENIRLLGETLGMELVVEAQERAVGPFSADILCKNVATDRWVVVENQLERTDHSHLGQLITYAAGLDAELIVWVAARFTDEHREALDWLNRATSEQFQFFGLEVELWRIGQSLPAPKFNVVSQPNEWAKQLVHQAHGELTPIKKLQLDYWQAFHEFLATRGTTLKFVKPLPQNWMIGALGRTGFKLCAVASTYDSARQTYEGHEIRAEVVIDIRGARPYFEALQAKRQEIEDRLQIPESLTWHSAPSVNMCRIYFRNACNLETRSDWRRQHEWLITRLEALHTVFAPIVRNLEPLAEATEGLEPQT